MILPTLSDDEVAGAPADEQLAAGEIAEIARLQPAAAQRLPGGVGILEVSGHDRWPPGDNPADMALGKPLPVVADDLDGVAGQWPAAADKANNPFWRCGSVHDRHGEVVANHAIPVNRVHLEAVARERDRERVLGQAITGHEARPAESGPGEPIRERAQRGGPDRLRTAARDPPA